MADAISSLHVVVEGKDETTKVLKGIESSIIRFVGAVSATLATINVAVFPLKNAADFEKELLDVGKTTEYTNKQLAELGDELKKLSYQTNVSAVDLAKVAAAGGQMGLGKEGVQELLAFTEATSRMASVLDVSFEEAGAGFGTLSNIFKLAAKDAEKLGSLLNELSNNSTATGAELIDMTKRIGTAGGTLNVKSAAALAAVGKDLGLTSETVGTSFNKIFLDLQSKAGQIAPLLGKPVEEFAALVRTDGVAALKEYVTALSRMDNVQRAIVGEQITGGGRIFALVTSLVNDANNGFALLDRHLGEANKGFDEGTSAINEQKRVLSGFLAQVQILKNVLFGLAETIGRQALPYLTRLVKSLQEVGKSKEVAEFFQRVAEWVGSAAVAFVDFIKYVSQFSAALGPLILGLKIFVGLKIAGMFAGAVSGMVQWILRIKEATAAWRSLITAQTQQQAVQKASTEVMLAQDKALKSGKSATPSAYGVAATYLNAALSPKFAKQDELKNLTASHTAAEEKLNRLVEQRDKALQRVNDQIKYGKDNMKILMQQSYDAVIEKGGTKKSAQAAANATKADVTRIIRDMDVRGSNYGAAFDAAIQKQEASLKSLATQASATQASLSKMSSIGLVFSTIGNVVGFATRAVVGFFGKFLAVGGAIAAVVSLVTYFLDLFGVLDTVTGAFKRFFGILDSEAIKRKRDEEERIAALEKEKKAAEELAKVYDNQKKAEATKVQSGVKGTEKPVNVLTGQVSLAEEIKQLDIINGKYADLTFKSAALASGVDTLLEQWGSVGRQLEEAKARYDAIRSSTEAAARSSALTGKPVDTKSLELAKAKVDELTKSYELLGLAVGRNQGDQKRVQEEMAKVAEEAAKQAAKLAPLYDEGGVAALKALADVKTAEEGLAKARKALEDVEGGSSPKASDEEKLAYVLAQENVRLLVAELTSLQAVYDEVRLSSAGATVFMANAFPDAANTSKEKIEALIRVLGGLGDGTNLAMEKQKERLDKQIADYEEKLAEIEAKRQKALGSVHLSDTADEVQQRKNVELINARAARDSSTLRASLGDALAKQQQLKLEGEQVKLLKSEYEKLSATRGKRDGGQGLVANFAQVAALKAFTDQQIAAQTQVEKAAKFNSDNLTKLYEQAQEGLRSAVNESKKDLQSLGQYFNNRNLSLKLANLSVQQGNTNDFLKKEESRIVEEERKRLEALGLSSEEINKQIDMLQEMFEWSNKMRAAAQDEQKQRLILSDTLKQINQEEQNIAESGAKAREYAKQAAEAQARGDLNAANSFGQKAREEAEKTKLAIETLNEKVKEFKSEAAKPIVGPAGAKLIVSDEEIRGVTERNAKARVEAAQAEEVALKQASASATQEYQTQQGKLKELKDQATDYQKILLEITKLAPALGAAQTAIAEKVLGNTAGMTEVAEGLKSIANSDFRGLDQFATVSAQADKIKEMERAIKGVAETYAQTVAPAGASISKISESVVSSLIGAGEVKTETLSAMLTSLEKGIKDRKIQAELTFPTATDTLQEQLKSKEFVANIKFVSTGDVQKNAEGGHIRGPGTGTSDSILSWLSNGEYVSDAQTTAFFGPNFFRMLKSVARGSRAGLYTLATKLSGGVRLPAFATGGYVGPEAQGVMAGVTEALSGSKDTIIGRVAVDLNVGGKTHTLMGERDQVDALVKALHKVNRG